MLIQLLKYLRGYVKIRVEGYSPERLLNLCNVNKMLLWGVENRENTYELYISVKDFKKMRPLVRKTGTKVVLLEKKGFPFFLHKFRKRKIFFFGMFFCVISIYMLSLFVWNIHFEGNVTQNNQELLKYLETIGVSHGTRKSNIVCEEIETNLRKTYPNMLWVSAEMRGTRIIVQIKENLDKDIISEIEIKEEKASSIVAEASGTVESVVVRSGTPIVKEGDMVEAGQILVEGYYAIKNDAGEVVRYEGVAADADIQILVTEKYHDKYSVEYEDKQYTEKKRLAVKLIIGEKNYQFIPKIKFKHYETIKKSGEIHLTENFYLPFSVELEWYLEYVPQMKRYSEKELLGLANSRFYKNYKNILQKGVQIIEKDVKMNTNGKVCHVTGTIDLLVPVTKKVPANIPEIQNKVSLEGEN